MSNEATPPAAAGFRDLGLSEAVLKSIEAIGYEAPSSIQAETIPHIVKGKDVLGQAQTGTGKTAAFALPLLSRLKPDKSSVQVLVLVPTRELAIQVAEAFQKYAKHIPRFHVLPIYGGSSYGSQHQSLKRGVQVVVGTTGRVCDHLRRGTLDLSQLDCLVIDEADEMLRMGFIEEVEFVLEQTPASRQVTLFSATMSEPIRRIARRHMKEPVEITIKAKTTTAALVKQRYWMVSGLHKLDALTRILEGESFEAMIVFVRTKSATVELATKLEARGFTAEALNGDIDQREREQIVDRLRGGDLDILVATDVAARGLDVPRITHIINYDIPNDTESYVHRIGRTGRAGRTGEAILFVSPREKRLLYAIEKATNQKIEAMRLPTPEFINDTRIAKFKQRITDTLGVEELGTFYQMIESYISEHNVPALEVAAALARMVQGDQPLLLNAQPEPVFEERRERTERTDRPERSERPERAERSESAPRRSAEDRGAKRYRIEVGWNQGVKPGQIVGAIANEAGLEGKDIGHIEIRGDFTTVELPDLPPETLAILSKARVCGRPMRIQLASEGPQGDAPGGGGADDGPRRRFFKTTGAKPTFTRKTGPGWKKKPTKE